MSRPSPIPKEIRSRAYKAKWRANHKEQIQAYNNRTKDKAKVRGRKFYEKNRELTIKKAKVWYLKNKDKRSRWKTTSKAVFNRYKKSAERTHRAFLLTLEQVDQIIHETCAYCGQFPDPINGIDRKDNSIGYEMFNSVACCAPCNRMKHVLPIEDFLKKCTQIAEHQQRMRLPNKKYGPIQ